MIPLPPQQGRAFCRTGHPVLDLPKLSFKDLLPYRFAGAHFSVALLEQVTEIFKLSDRHAIEFAIESDNIAVVRDAVIHSDLILLSIPGCVLNELSANLLVELPIDLSTPSQWQSVTLKNAVAHPAIASLRAAIVKVTREREKS